jgi:pyruvate-formate lyase-activating enzyme
MALDLRVGVSEKGEPSGPLEALISEPFLHVESGRLFNPLTDRELRPGDSGYEELRAVALGEMTISMVPPVLRSALAQDGWLVEDASDLAGRFRLKYVTLEANTSCNQGCYFCPVSTHPRDPYLMPMEFYEGIVVQLAEYRDTIEAVSMIQYNEPTIDKRFVEQVAVLKRHGLPPAVLSNGTGLTPKRVDEILELGGLHYLSINLSTLDRERYAADRRGDHLAIVLRNLDYFKNRPLAKTMEIAVLGQGDDVHRRDHEQIRERFAGSHFSVKYYEVMNRAGNVAIGQRPGKPLQRLCGCEQTGSRPVQWVHITPSGKCVLCCQDYFDQYVVGDLNDQSLGEILSGPEMSLYRRWLYGLEEAPSGFICRNCIYALTR